MMHPSEVQTRIVLTIDGVAHSVSVKTPKDEVDSYDWDYLIPFFVEESSKWIGGEDLTARNKRLTEWLALPDDDEERLDAIERAEALQAAVTLFNRARTLGPTSRQILLEKLVALHNESRHRPQLQIVESPSLMQLDRQAEGDVKPTTPAEPFELIITFGQRYAQEPHPVDHRIHPDGWIVSVGTDYATAREQAWGVLGEHFAFDYPADTFTSEGHYPRGEIGRIVDGELTMAVPA